MIGKPWLRIWARTALLLCATTPGLGCSDYVDAWIVIHIKASVIDSRLRPVSHASMWLYDHRFSEERQPQALWKPICTTDLTGKCSADVHYGYGYTSWHWPSWFDRPHRATLSRRFEVLVTSDDKVIARKMLTAISAPQIQGVRDVEISIQLAPGG